MHFRLPASAGRLAGRILAWLPSSCALCGRSGAHGLCAGCRADHFDTRCNRCRQCAIRLAPEEAGLVCGACLSRPPAFDRTIAAVDYAPPLDQLVLGLKFNAQLPLAPLFARLLQEAAGAEDLPDLLTAVPLGAQRLRERGFNQAVEIARPLARELGIELVPALAVRTRDTAAQSLLHPDERRRNVRHAFVVPAGMLTRVQGRHVGVVDDVATTGETLNELAATLKRFGAARVTNFVFARTLLK